tara:strand:+ start:980 stop:1897 length:918 start_codon:yes stop_codon:yes gene_type:complete
MTKSLYDINNGSELIDFFKDQFNQDCDYISNAHELIYLILQHEGVTKLDKTTSSLIEAIDILINATSDWQSEFDEPHAYHNLNHMAHVATMVVVLIFYHQDFIVPKNNHVLTLNDQLLLLLVALVHDAGHPAMPNPSHQPYRNEKLAIRFIEKALEEHEISAEIMAQIELLLLSTSPSGAYQYLKANNLFKQAGIWGQKPENYNDEIFECLKELTVDRKLCLMASLLNDADLSAGAGLGQDISFLTTKWVAQEMGFETISKAELLENQKRFLNRVFGESGFLSMAGRALMNENYITLCQKIETIN